MNIAKEIKNILTEANQAKTSAYDTSATVTRVEDDTIWVHIAGGVDETPVKKTVSAKAGDEVQIRVGGGRAWVVGNASSPPTDDTRAIVADNNAQSAAVLAESAGKSATIAREAAERAVADAATASQAASDAQTSADAAQDALKSVVTGATTVEKAVSVMQTALEAVVEYDPNAKQGTFTGDGTETSFALSEKATNILSVTVDGESVEYTSALSGGVTVITITPAPADESSIVVSYDTTQEYFWHDANGAHVLGDTSGYRNDIDSTGMRIVDVNTETSVAEFGANGARIGKAASGYKRSIINDSSFSIYDYDKQIVSMGGVYGLQIGTSLSATTEIRLSFQFNYDTGKMLYDTMWSQQYISGMPLRMDIYTTDDNVYSATIEIPYTNYQYSGYRWVELYDFFDSYPYDYDEVDHIVIENVDTQIASFYGDKYNMDIVFSGSYTSTIEIYVPHDGGDEEQFLYNYGIKSSSNSITAIQWDGSISSGERTKAEGVASIAVGADISSSGNYAQSFGKEHYADGDYSHAEGIGNQASGLASHVEGRYTKALGQYAHVQNLGTNAGFSCQTAIGSYNDNHSDALFEVGNGTDDNNRSNAFRVDADGDIHAAQHVKAVGNVMADNDVFDQYGNVRTIPAGQWFGSVSTNTAASTGTAKNWRSNNYFTGASYSTIFTDSNWMSADTNGIKFLKSGTYKLTVTTYLQAAGTGDILGARLYNYTTSTSLCDFYADASNSNTTLSFTVISSISANQIVIPQFMQYSGSQAWKPTRTYYVAELLKPL